MTTTMTIATFRRALPEDASILAAVSKRSFDADLPAGAVGPPGYDSAQWQARIMDQGDYHAIVADGEIIGGIVVFRYPERHCELGRIFIAPEHQCRGIGREAIAFLWHAYPDARRWTLDTPAWNKRSRAFSAANGFTETGITRSGFALFERLTGA